MEIIKELCAVAGAFADHGVSYAVCGGLAVAIHGRPRMTIDIDFIVAANELATAVEAAASVGFDDVTGWVQLPGAMWGINRLYRINKVHGSELLTLDLLEIDSAENELLANRQVFELEGQHLVVLSKSALVKMKEGTGRTKDKLDVEMLNDGAE